MPAATRALGRVLEAPAGVPVCSLLMASLSNNYQLLNGLQFSQNPPAAKKDKKKASPATPGVLVPLRLRSQYPPFSSWTVQAMLIRCVSDLRELSAAEPAELPPRAPARVTSVEAPDPDGCQPAKRSVARSRSGHLASKVSGGAAEASPVSRLVQTVEQGLKGAITPADWLTLWRTWILQVGTLQRFYNAALHRMCS